METNNYEETVEETTETPEVVEETTEEPTDESEEETTEVDWEARALKAERAIEKSKKKAKDTPKREESTNDAVLSRLETRGVMEADDQNYVLRFAKSEGISPIEALSDSIVQDRLKANNLARTSVEATPKSNNRANTAQNEVDVAVKKFEKDGTLPDGNPVLTSKILKRLSNRG